MEGSVLLLEAGQQGLPPAFHILKGLGNRFRLAQEEVGLLQRLLQGLLQGRQGAAQLGAGGLQVLQDAGSLFPGGGGLRGEAQGEGVGFLILQ